MNRPHFVVRLATGQDVEATEVEKLAYGWLRVTSVKFEWVEDAQQPGTARRIPAGTRYRQYPPTSILVVDEIHDEEQGA